VTEQPDKRERILQAASKLFTKFGPRKTTIDEVAKEAGVAKGTVYLYFKSKEEILLSFARTEMDILLTALRSAARTETGALRKMQAFLTMRFGAQDAIMEKFNTTREIMLESASYPVVEIARKEFFVAELLIIRDILELGIEGGDFRPVKNIDKTCRALSFMMQGLSEPWDTLDGGSIGVTERVSLFMDIIIKGLKS
jgi:AcrR family transcriptional regulator